jgi:hypothetical protein
MLILMVFLFDSSINARSIFDSVKWEKDKEKKNISIYICKDLEKKLNYYKAETVLENIEGNVFFNNLLDLNNYPQIFPKIIFFKDAGPSLSADSSGICYFRLNFAPLKNRDYYANFRSYKEESLSEKKYVIEWWPLSDNENSFEPESNFLRVKMVHSRWQITETENKIKISIEYYNDFKVIGPKPIIYAIEKDITFNALDDLIKYTKKKIDLTMK